ncbi:hypothetical protein [Litorivivens sp.]|uniref:hypothetical protein n=1 Tax=Litorivivens sp. TaxID=2020868 RepID=UPI00356377E5
MKANVERADEGEKGVVLIADRALGRRLTTKRFLEEQGYRVIAVGSGAEARLTLQNNNVAALLVTRQLPDSSGLEIAKDLSLFSLSGRPYVLLMNEAHDTPVNAAPGVDDIMAAESRSAEELHLRLRRAFRCRAYWSGGSFSSSSLVA